MGTVLKNSDGRVLKNNAGSILKQNYNFGKAYRKSSTIYLSCPRLEGYSIPIGITVAYWFVNLGSPTGFEGERLRINNNLALYWRNTNLTNYQIGLGSNYRQFVNNTGANRSYLFCDFYNSSAQPNIYINNSLNSWSSSWTDPGYINAINNFRISFGAVGSLKINSLLVYNRRLSVNERSYLYNNGLGNERLSDNGLLIDSKMSTAEILDFSTGKDGSNMQVGCRDISGNNHHLMLVNLPSGTLQEKVDWANSNIFINL